MEHTLSTDRMKLNSPEGVVKFGDYMKLENYTASQSRGFEPAEAEYVAAEETWWIFLLKRWTKDEEPGYGCVVTAGLWRMSKSRKRSQGGERNDGGGVCQITCWDVHSSIFNIKLYLQSCINTWTSLMAQTTSLLMIFWMTTFWSIHFVLYFSQSQSQSHWSSGLWRAPCLETSGEGQTCCSCGDSSTLSSPDATIKGQSHITNLFFKIASLLTVCWTHIMPLSFSVFCSTALPFEFLPCCTSFLALIQHGILIRNLTLRVYHGDIWERFTPG